MRRFWQQVLRLWDSASIYTPLVMMGALALGTYWLQRNTPALNSAEAVKEVRHATDYFMRGFSVKNFDDAGLLKSQVMGVEARHYPATDTLEIDQGRIRSMDAQGRLTTSTASRVLSNGDGSELQLIGNARVVRESFKDAAGQSTPSMQFRGEFLHIFLNDERVKSHKPVVLTRGNDQFSGDTLAYDNLTGVAELKGRVKGVLTPTAGRALPR
ncbi:MAG: LPS export ABC transporter periplasmic protein LptC [Polaromonas sp.]|nr:MAG: LPS export ABC transporter periplasmic protein LptC [Polaromonas sp.]